MKLTSLPEFKRRIYTLHGRYRYIDPCWRSRLSGCELKDCSAWQSVRPASVITETDTTQVYRVTSSEGRLIFKRYSVGPSWRYFLRPGRAACEWSGLHALRNADIPVPELVAFGEDRVMGRLTAGYVITREIESAMDLETFAVKVWYAMPQPQKKQVFNAIRTLVFDIVKRAHHHLLFHHDLYWRNILIGQANGEYQLWLIDCPRLKRGGFMRAHARMVDLSCLARVALSMLSSTERFRSLLLFLDGDRQQARLLFREIEAHHRRSRHPPKIFDPAQRHASETT